MPDLFTQPPADLPRIALSIRQPWAWAIINAGKDIENRDWSTKFRGPVCIHAAKRMTNGEFDKFVDLSRWIVSKGRWTGDFIPERKALSRGGIVGVCDIVDCVDASESPWFLGRYGFVLRNARPVEFFPAKGALRFFDWQRNIEAGAAMAEPSVAMEILYLRARVAELEDAARIAESAIDDAVFCNDLSGLAMAAMTLSIAINGSMIT